MAQILKAVCLAAAVSAACLAGASTSERGPVRHSTNWAPPTESARVIIKLKDQAHTLALATASGARLRPHAAQILSQRVGLTLSDGRALGPRTQVLRATGLDSNALAAQLAKDPDVEWAVVDHRRFAVAAPNDPLYPDNLTTTTPTAGQWYLRAPNAAQGIASSINIEPAWDITHGSSSLVIAIVDTGITVHPDLQDKLLPGYDFIVDIPTANDGDARDGDPSDPGDWITAAENNAGPFKDCAGGIGSYDSSWHGTQVAGILGAQADNGIGMAGIARDVKLLPVRALGKCGGYDSDIIAGMTWAGGISVPDVPANANPARVINASLGGSGACDQAYQDAITQLTARNVVLVVAAGNDNGLAVNAPANCPGVIAVAGLRHSGDKVGYSNIGPEISIAAPAGNCVLTGTGDPCLYPILTTSNTGTTSPVAPTYTTSYGEVSIGTSFSAPMVAGTVGLMLSAAPTMTNAQVLSVLKNTATPFPTTGGTAGTPQCSAPTATEQAECYCTTATCGAGMLNAGNALAATAVIAVSPTAVISGASEVNVDTSLTLTSDGSAPVGSRTIVAYQWQILTGGTFASINGAANASSVSLVGVAPGVVTLQLTVTDNEGHTGTKTAAVTVAAASQPSGNSGGGASSPAWLLLLAVGGLWLAPRRMRVTTAPESSSSRPA